MKLLIIILESFIVGLCASGVFGFPSLGYFIAITINAILMTAVFMYAE